MNQPYARVILMLRKITKEITQTFNQATELLKQTNVSMFLEEKSAQLLNNALPPIPVLPWPQIRVPDLVVTFGGDGCFLSGARAVLPTKASIIGVNCGTSFGFLTDLNTKTINQLLNIVKGEYVEEPRSVLLIKNLNQFFFAINEIAIYPGKKSLFNCYLKINYQQSINYRADGLIIATPTGTTGQALSAGGAVLDPQISAIEIVPILSQHLGIRPLILPEYSCLTFSLNALENNSPYDIIIDGYEQQPINGELLVTNASLKLRCIHPQNYDFYRKLTDKLRWQWNFK